MRGLRTICAAAMRGAKPIDGPVWLSIEACYAWPRSCSAKKRAANKWRTSKPDYDNLAKLVGDALNGVAWCDDSQVAKATVEKLHGDVPGLTVRIARPS
jgi:Holliday junction resolvase RusA-like endonuclease